MRRNDPRKALVLAAGRGTRLGALTSDLPKPMLDLGGRPLLEHTLAYLKAFGFAEIAVNLHFKGELIREHFGDGSRLGVRLCYSPEQRLLGTAGAVKKLEPFFADCARFLVLYGDLLTDQNLDELLAFHDRSAADATLVLHQRAGSNSLVLMDERQRITDFLERPGDEIRARAPYPWVNSGIQVLTPGLLPLLAPNTPLDLPRDLYVPHIRDLRIFGFPLHGFRVAIDSPGRYEQAQAALRDGLYRPF